GGGAGRQQRQVVGPARPARRHPHGDGADRLDARPRPGAGRRGGRHHRRDQADVGLRVPGRGGQGGRLRVHPLGVDRGGPPPRLGALHHHPPGGQGGLRRLGRRLPAAGDQGGGGGVLDQQAGEDAQDDHGGGEIGRAAG